MKPTFEPPPPPAGGGFDAISANIAIELDALVALEREEASVHARRARHLVRLVELAEQEAALVGGATSNCRNMVRRSLRAEIALAVRRSEQTIDRLMADAETLLTDLPGTLASLENGDVSYAHARSMVVHAVSLPVESRAGFERAVLPAACGLSPARFDDAARCLRESFHPESITRRAEKAHEDRTVWLDKERDGMATLHHHLPAVDALAIHDALDQAARAARCETEPRTQAQLRSDFLADAVLGRTTTPGLGFTPTVIVTVPAAVLANVDLPGAGSSHAGGDTGTGGTTTGTGTARGSHSGAGIGAQTALLHGYGPIDPDLARHIASKAPSFLKVLTDPATGDVLEVTGRYRISTALRQALIVADEHCRYPGCGRRAARCELDHTEDWATGGISTASNLAHLCSGHHHLKHQTGWKVARPPKAKPKSRDLDWESPRGRIHTTKPAYMLLKDPPY
jgi:hypothetical protein